jgi:hypothetical protein
MQETKAFEHTTKKTDNMFFAHDVFNMFTLSFISVIVLHYLYHCTDWSLFGTDQIGIAHLTQFAFLWKVFMAYIVFDTIWISLCPHIAPSGAKIVLTHHVICIVSAFIPQYHPHTSWYMAVALLTELSTFFVTCRRNAPLNTLLYQMLHYLVLLTWFPIRLVIYPALCLVIAKDYYHYSLEISNFLNLRLYGLLSQVFLTYLSVHWSIDFIRKLKKK